MRAAPHRDGDRVLQKGTDAEASVFERIQLDVKAEIDTGVQFALAAPYPDVTQVDEDVYA